MWAITLCSVCPTSNGRTRNAASTPTARSTPSSGQPSPPLLRDRCCTRHAALRRVAVPTRARARGDPSWVGHAGRQGLAPAPARRARRSPRAPWPPATACWRAPPARTTCAAACPSNPSGSSSGRRPIPVPSSNPVNSTPNISCVSRSCHAAPGPHRRRAARRSGRRPAASSSAGAAQARRPQPRARRRTESPRDAPRRRRRPGPHPARRPPTASPACRARARPARPSAPAPTAHEGRRRRPSRWRPRCAAPPSSAPEPPRARSPGRQPRPGTDGCPDGRRRAPSGACATRPTGPGSRVAPRGCQATGTPGARWVMRSAGRG